jgi:hypothetical protein
MTNYTYLRCLMSIAEAAAAYHGYRLTSQRGQQYLTALLTR